MRHLLRVGVLVLAASQASAQNASIPVPPTIKLEGVPEIPVSLAERLAPFGEFRSAELLSVHPTRRQILIATSFGPRRHIHLVDGPGRARTQLTFGAAVTGGASFEPSRGEYFVFRRDPTGGSERPQLYRYDMATAAVTLLTDGQSRNGGNSVVWSNKAGLVAFDSNRRSGKDRDIWVVDPMNPSAARIAFESSGNWIAQDWSPDDRELLVEERVSGQEGYLWRVDVKTGAKTALTPREGERTVWMAPRFAPDGKTVYALSDRGGEFPRLWRTELGSGTWTPITPEGTVVEAYSLSPNGRSIAIVSDRDAMSVLELVDAATLKTRLRPKIPVGTIRGLLWRGNGEELTISLESIHTLRDVYKQGAEVRTTWRQGRGGKAAAGPEAAR